MNKIFALVIAIAAIAFTSQAQNTWTQKADFGGGSGYGAIGFSIGSKGYIGTGSFGKYFWEYDPVNNTWTQKADVPGSERRWAVGFSIENKGYVGLGEADGVDVTDFWEYDPVNNTWTQKSDFAGPARVSAVGFSVGSKGYVGTGIAEPCCFYFLRDFWEYDPSTDTWTKKAHFRGTPRIGAVGFSIGDKGYIGLGYREDGVGAKKDFWEYDPSTDKWIPKADFGGVARESAVGFSVGGRGYVGTGNDDNYDDPSNLSDFWAYDPVQNAWSKKADFAGGARSNAVGFSIGDKGYIGTGNNYSVYYDDFWEYTPDSLLCVVPTATIIPLGNLDICTKGFVKLQAASDYGYKYQWNRNNVDVPGATNQIFKARVAGNYRVRISAGPGCLAVSKKTVVYTSCKLDEETEFSAALNLYPNPTDGTFTLYLTTGEEGDADAKIEVLNLLGQIIISENEEMENGKLLSEIQLSGIAADGMYLVKVTINDQVYMAQINLQR